MLPLLSTELVNGASLGGTIGFIIGSILMYKIMNYRDINYKYVPAGAIIVKEKDWQKVEVGIAKSVSEARSFGVKLGRRQVIKMMEERLNNNKERRNSYEILGLKPGQEGEADKKLEDIKMRFNQEYLECYRL